MKKHHTLILLPTIMIYLLLYNYCSSIINYFNPTAKEQTPTEASVKFVNKYNVLFEFQGEIFFRKQDWTGIYAKEIGKIQLETTKEEAVYTHFFKTQIKEEVLINHQFYLVDDHTYYEIIGITRVSKEFYMIILDRETTGGGWFRLFQQTKEVSPEVVSTITTNTVNIRTNDVDIEQNEIDLEGYHIGMPNIIFEDGEINDKNVKENPTNITDQPFGSDY